MVLKVIGTGVGRTGTYSLKLALSELGLGPCYHMEELMHRLPTHLPLWQDVARGTADFASIFEEFQTAVDWPVAGYTRELLAAYPEAKFIHTVRSAQSWAESFSATIYELLAGRAHAPAELRGLLDLSASIIERTGFPPGLDASALAKNFEAHTEAVKATVPKDQLLIFDVKEGWEPLCRFLGVATPSTPFPRSNSRDEFWARIRGAA